MFPIGYRGVKPPGSCLFLRLNFATLLWFAFVSFCCYPKALCSIKRNPNPLQLTYGASIARGWFCMGGGHSLSRPYRSRPPPFFLSSAEFWLSVSVLGCFFLWYCRWLFSSYFHYYYHLLASGALVGVFSSKLCKGWRHDLEVPHLFPPPIFFYCRVSSSKIIMFFSLL